MTLDTTPSPLIIPLWLGLPAVIGAVIAGIKAMVDLFRDRGRDQTRDEIAKTVGAHTATLAAADIVQGAIKTDVNSNAAAQEERVRRGEARIEQLTNDAAMAIQRQMDQLKQNATDAAAAALTAKAVADTAAKTIADAKIVSDAAAAVLEAQRRREDDEDRPKRSRR